MAIALDEKVNKMRTMLQNSNEKEREVIYYGVAEILSVYAAKKMKTEELNKAGTALRLNTIVDGICELTIVDRRLLEIIVKKVFEYHYNIKTFEERLADMISWSCLNDALGISNCYSPTDIELINSNFELYKKAIVTTIEYLSTLPTEEVGAQ